jgi:hypothetical protein
MIYLVSPDWMVYTFLLVANNQLVLDVMSLGELTDYKLLHGHNVDYIHLSLDVVENQNTKLVGDTAIVEVVENI